MQDASHRKPLSRGDDFLARDEASTPVVSAQPPGPLTRAPASHQRRQVRCQEARMMVPMTSLQEVSCL